ncbi:hypothetical protein V8G54_005828 [Vigna mungo]|uniref:Uncharacterized protein n=1 Tax=Vigna mungo TaxID=3915 RepID=A0AAQ3NXV0_VIGMU
MLLKLCSDAFHPFIKCQSLFKNNDADLVHTYMELGPKFRFSSYTSDNISAGAINSKSWITLQKQIDTDHKITFFNMLYFPSKPCEHLRHFFKIITLLNYSITHFNSVAFF